MNRNTVFAIAAALALLGACGQKDSVTTHSQPAAPGTSPQPKPKPLAGEPQPAPGNPVYPGNAPVAPGGAPAPGDGKTPEKAAGK